jgi:hypothetical protein
VEADVLKVVLNLTSEFTSSAVKLVVGYGCGVPRDGFETAGLNFASSKSRIADVGAAREIIEITKATILSMPRKSVSMRVNLAQRDVINLIR